MGSRLFKGPAEFIQLMMKLLIFKQVIHQGRAALEVLLHERECDLHYFNKHLPLL